MEHNLTPWSTKKQVPVREGLYQRKAAVSYDPTIYWTVFRNGKWWRASSIPEKALMYAKSELMSGYQRPIWRGIYK